MTIKLSCAMAICLLICSSFSTSLGCMYTVRDVGFVDLGSIQYYLYYYIRDDTPENLISTFRQISYAALMDSNVQVEVINVDQQDIREDREAKTMHNPAMKYLDLWDLRSFPAAVLASPNGQSLVLTIPSPNKPFKQIAWSALESIVASPKREEILSSIVETYCVVLLIQGKDAAKNEKARAAVVNAIEAIIGIMSQMPKSIEKPPHLIVVPSELFPQERVLLWSLGVDENQMGEPYVALLYGRGRRIGPLLRGEEITVNKIFNTLSVIGSSCECGLDRRWILGTMLPLRWDRKIQSEVVRRLGFDAESPLVKMEISQMLSWGSSLGTDEPPKGDALEEYSEETVILEDGQAVVTISPAQLHQLVSRKPEVDTDFHPYRRALFIISGMVLLLLAGGAFIMLKARRRTS